MNDNNEMQNNETEQPVTRSSSKKNFLKKYCTLDTLKMAGIVLVLFIVMPLAAFGCTGQPSICRIAEIFLPLGVALFGCGYALKKKTGSKGWKETTALFAGYTIFLASLFLTFKFSQYDSHAYMLYIGEGLMVLVIIVMRSSVMPLFILPLLIWTDAEVSKEFGYVLLTIIILYISYLYFIKKERFLCKLWIGILPFAMSLHIAILIAALLRIQSDIHCIIIAILFSSLYYTIHLWIKGNPNVNSNAPTFKIISYLQFSISLIFVIEQYSSWEDFTNWELPFQACIVTALLIIIALIVKIWKKKKIECQEWITLPIVAVVYFSGDYQEIAASILFIAIIEFAIYDNYKKNDLLGICCCICLQFWWIAAVWTKISPLQSYLNREFDLYHDKITCFILLIFPIIASIIIGIHHNRKQKRTIKKAKSLEPTA